MDRPAVLRSVRRYTTALLLVQTALAALLAWRPGPPRVGAVYLVAALPWTLLVNAVLGRNVHLLYTAEGQPLTRLNLATRVTLIRVLSIPLVGVLVLQGESMMAGLVFLGAAPMPQCSRNAAGSVWAASSGSARYSAISKPMPPAPITATRFPATWRPARISA